MRRCDHWPTQYSCERHSHCAAGHSLAHKFKKTVCCSNRARMARIKSVTLEVGPRLLQASTNCPTTCTGRPVLLGAACSVSLWIIFHSSSMASRESRGRLEKAQDRLSALVSTISPYSVAGWPFSFPSFDNLPKVEGQPQGCLWGFFDRKGRKDEIGSTPPCPVHWLHRQSHLLIKCETMC